MALPLAAYPPLVAGTAGELVLSYPPSTAALGNMARAAIKYGPDAVKAAQTIRKNWTARKRRQNRRNKMMVRRQIGEDIGASNAKRYNLVDTPTPAAQNTRTLYSYEVTDIPKTVYNDIDSRQRDMIHFVGFKFCQEWQNNGSKPLLCNLAVISPKQKTSASLETDFFRGYGTSRAIDFNTSMESLDFHCRPINADKWVILHHQRFTLGTQDATSYKDEKNYQLREKFVKVNRQLRYDSQTSAAVSPIYLVHWFDEFQTAGGTIPSSKLTHAAQVTAYFRETKT